MQHLSRRTLMQSLLTVTALSGVAPLRAQPAASVDEPVSAAPTPEPFRHEDVVRRARDLASVPFDPSMPPLPEQLARLDYDGYREIRFREDKSLLAQSGAPFRMQMFHLGLFFERPVTINVVRDGAPMPVLYQPQLFEYGRNRFDQPFPINLGFAGFRLLHPLNEPTRFDELIAFQGASYFRFLGRDQRYGLSARGLAVNVRGTGGPEEFPFFREFWVDVSDRSAPERVVVHALLDGAAATGAYRFTIYPQEQTVVDVSATLFARRSIDVVGLAPLTSMFYVGENEPRQIDDFRPEMHDSDGLLVHNGAGEWLWRPLRNPSSKSISAFLDTRPRGFGLLQRDRVFENYQDLETNYHLRPSYWVEPTGDWGEGQVELVEIPTQDEAMDNIVAYWQPRRPIEPGSPFSFAYRIRAMMDVSGLHPSGKVVHTFSTQARAALAKEPEDPLRRRFIVDFGGGDLAYHRGAPERVEIVASASKGEIVHTFVVPNEHVDGFRAALDVRVAPGETTDLRAFLRVGEQTLTETWTYPWTAPAE